MIDRANLIMAIETAKEQSIEYAQDYILCPLKETDMILELLKEHEARVLSMDELLKLEKAEAPCVWLEVREITDRYWFEGWAEPVHFDETETHLYGFGVDVPVEARLCDYEVEYRCWNHKPTEGQQLAVKWNE